MAAATATTATTTAAATAGEQGVQDILPNQTLYVSYVYDKLSKETTKHVLYALFSQFGRVIDVVYSKPLRGRAWVVFEDVRMATEAKLSLDGFELYGKGIRVSYARTKSDAVAKRDGSWKPDGRSRQVRYDELVAGDAGKAAQSRGGEKAGPSGDVDVGTPNKTLFVEGLPEGTKEEMLSVLFGQFPGFVGGRLVPGKVGMAFVDFNDVGSAGIALQGLQGFQIGVGSVLRLTYAKMLDAYASGPLRYDGGTPIVHAIVHAIVHEIRAIAKSGCKATILIDDCRLMGSAEWGYVTKDEILRELDELRFAFEVSYTDGYQKDDIMVVTPL